MKTRYPTSEYLEHHFQHLHSAVILEAAKSYVRLVKNANGKMIITLSNETDLAGIGLALVPMIRDGLVHAIVTTGAAIEGDLDRLSVLAKRASSKRASNVKTLYDDIRKHWRKAEKQGRRYFHWEIINQYIQSTGQQHDAFNSNSWLAAACEHDIPVYAPGIENSAIGRLFCADVVCGKLSSHATLKSGTEQFAHLCHWYQRHQQQHNIGIFQVGDNATTNFCRSVVPSIGQDQNANCKLLRYCTVITESTMFLNNPGFKNYECLNHDQLLRSHSGKTSSHHQFTPHPTYHDVQNPEHQTFNITAEASIIVPLIFNYIQEQLTRQRASDLLSRTLSKVSYG